MEEIWSFKLKNHPKNLHALYLKIKFMDEIKF